MSTELTKQERAKQSLSNLQSKQFKMIFFAPNTNSLPSGAVIEIYNQAMVMRRNGYDTYILTESKEYEVPAYLDQDAQALPHLASDSEKFKVAPEDWLIIPEFFTPLMEQTKKLSCGRIVLAQSYDYTITSNIPGMTWKDMGMTDVLVTSGRMKEFIEEWHGINRYDIQTYTIGIPEYFKNGCFKKPVITFYSRNNNDIIKINKLFYLRFPELRWIVFEDLRGTTREEFANKLNQSPVTLWLDRTAGFGQTPVEAATAGSVPVALVPDIVAEYMSDETGIWSSDFYEIPNLLGAVLKMWFKDELPKELLKGMSDMAANYTPEKSEASILAAYQHFISKRETLLTEALTAAEAEAKLYSAEETI